MRLKQEILSYLLDSSESSRVSIKLTYVLAAALGHLIQDAIVLAVVVAFILSVEFVVWRTAIKTGDLERKVKKIEEDSFL